MKFKLALALILTIAWPAAAVDAPRLALLMGMIDRLEIPTSLKSQALESAILRERTSGHLLSTQDVKEIVEALKKRSEKPKHRCFTCGMRVLTPLGYRRLDELKTNDTVFSWNESRGRLVVNYVANVFLSGDESYGLLSAPTGVELKVTGDHPFYVPQEREYRRIDGLDEKAELLAIDEPKCEARLWPRGRYDHGGRGQVITISVKEEPHNFIVEGLLVHNKPIF